ncbi:uncharacterized protein BBA_01706 [Beauveria bassiana ARSEF 2860]|uniref:BZIP domain-containing protein n=1 Tax=Beauveria bassiana (strain ARSEF 2860) TaxID=655819 RepID=J5K6P6_BEAB2|nr:uncharacterized protein BBA_01706 [Beauveria bassiana ARSEF 2860]EJP69741.1 hypothetical protein BBA_01706 [Beauveria bassiana ARSEF 2860]
MSETSHNSGKPRTRQRVYKTPPQLDVPDIEDDAAERKRVLNVLAQRRYRKIGAIHCLTRTNSNAGEKKRRRQLKQQSQDEPEGEAIESLPGEPVGSEPSAHISCAPEPLSIDSISGIDDGWPGSLGMSVTPLLLNSNIESSPVQAQNNWNTLHTSLNPAGDLFSLDFFTPTSNPGSPPSFDTSPKSVNSDGSLSDSYLLPVYELTLLKGLLRIAERLGSPKDVWSLTSQSPFTKGGGTPAHQLPPTWQPTATQIMMPHHPFLDFLPWPSVRDKVIDIFSLPEGSRPPSAAGPTGLANLAYDIEDNSEGVRIYGDDPYDPAYWEVGQVFFQRWWFLFDRDIIATSNRWRRLRGAPPLAIKAAGEEKF